MNTLDIILLIPLLYGAYDGYKKGFVLMVVGFLALILGIIGGFKLLQLGINFLMEYFPNMPRLLPLLSFLLIFILIFIGIYFLGVAIKATLDFTIFAGTLDNVAGGILGFLQASFSLSVIVWLLKQSRVIPIKYTSDSLVFKYLDNLAPYVVKFFEFLLPFAKDLFRSIKHIF